MQGVLIILVLVSGVGIKFNTGQLVNCRYNAPSEGLKLPTTIGVNPLWLEKSYLMSEETSPLQKDLNSSVSSNSEIARKPTVMNYVIEGTGGIVGEIVGAAAGYYLINSIISSSFFEGDIGPIGALLFVGACGLGAAASVEAFAIGTAAGVSIAGKIMHQEGSFKKALIGSNIGYLSGALLILAPGSLYKAELIGKDTALALIASTVILSSAVGAVIGYNRK